MLLRLIFVFSLIPLLGLAHSTSSPNRLIEINHGVQKWMTEEEIHELRNEVHAQGGCGGFMDITGLSAPSNKSVSLFDLFEKPAPTQEIVVEELLQKISKENILATVEHLSSYPNRRYDSKYGLQAAEWIREQFQTIGQGRSDVTVDTFKHKKSFLRRNWIQPSIIARIQGTKYPDEIIILGGHEDSIHKRDNIFGTKTHPSPGADDNASGIATVIEVFRVLVESGYRPERTIEFMTYAAEEIGLKGSLQIAEHYSNTKKSVYAAIQFDMTLVPNAKGEMVFIGQNVNEKLTTFTKKLVDHYVKVPWSTGTCTRKTFCGSDHMSWHRYGFPVTFPTEADPAGKRNKNIHTEKDTLTSGFDLDFGLHFVRLGLAFAVETSTK